MNENFDINELRKFEVLENDWWDEKGKLKTLHHINPVRLRYINNAVSLKEKNVLDVGCGGGLLTEAMCNEGASVTGIDASETLIEVAKRHQKKMEKEISYFTTTAEEFSQQHEQAFDVITCMELIEHVPDVQSLLSSCAKMIRPGGQIIIATINRTLKAYLAAIVGAEYILKLLPKGTHDYSNFIKPSELSAWLRQYGFNIIDIAGMTYVPGVEYCTINNNPAVNYIIHAHLKA